jgi:hypothetical protein
MNDHVAWTVSTTSLASVSLWLCNENGFRAAELQYQFHRLGALDNSDRGIVIPDSTATF